MKRLTGNDTHQASFTPRIHFKPSEPAATMPQSYEHLNLKAIVFSFFLVLAANCYADNGRGPKGTNCTLNDPPGNSGELSGHGMEIRIFPRLKDMKHDYSGCQVMWMKYEKAWWKVGVTEMVRGKVKRIWTRTSPENLELQACNYKNGKGVSDNSASCPSDLDGLPAHTVPSGCSPSLDASTSEWARAVSPECGFD